MVSAPILRTQNRLFIKQRFEVAEWLGFETRNKYEIQDQEQRPIGFAAEQGRGLLQLLTRQVLGHWRSFEIHFYGMDRQPFLHALHPFRWYYQRLEVSNAQGKQIGVIEKQFAIFHKSFVVQNAQAQIVMQVSSPLWKIWTFPFLKMGQQVAVIRKKWAGLLAESITDKDRFMIEYTDLNLREDERLLVLAAAIFIDMQYFEKKA